MLILILRTVLIYCIIVFSMRLMGKKQLGELQPSELVSTILISNLASISIESPEIPVAGSVVPVLMIVSLEILISAWSARCKKVASLISGNSKIIMYRGKIDQDMLRQLRFSADDLLEALREKNIFEPMDVELALVETNGTISVCKRPGAQPMRLDDLQPPENSGCDTPSDNGKSDISFKGQRLPQQRLPKLPVIVDGGLEADTLPVLGLTRGDIDRILEKESCTLQQTLLLLCSPEKEYYFLRRDTEKKNG